MAWSRQDILERSVDYIYGEMSETERHSYEAALANHPDLRTDVLQLQRTSKIVANLAQYPLPKSATERLQQHAAQQVRRSHYATPEPGESFVSRLAAVLFQPAAATGLVALLVVGVGALVVDRGAIEDRATVTGNRELAQEIQAEGTFVDGNDRPTPAAAKPAYAPKETRLTAQPPPAEDRGNTENTPRNGIQDTIAVPQYPKQDTRATVGLGDSSFGGIKPDTRPAGKLNEVPNAQPSPRLAAPDTDVPESSLSRRFANGEKKQKSNGDVVDAPKSSRFEASKSEGYQQAELPPQSVNLGQNAEPTATPAPSTGTSGILADKGDLAQYRDDTTRTTPTFEGAGRQMPDQAEWLRNSESQNVRGRAEVEPTTESVAKATISQPGGITAAISDSKDENQQVQQRTAGSPSGSSQPSGDVLYNSGDFSGAIVAYERELSENPERAAQIEHRLAIAYRKSNQFSKAIDRYQELFVRYPSYINRTTALSELAQLYLDQGRILDADSVADLLEKTNAPPEKVATLRAQITLLRAKTSKSVPQAAPDMERMKADDSNSLDNLPAPQKTVVE